ncbi:hypothetical protein Q1695_007293 [Nippostrongylus brasiliensis]|nr:hypothetical protein Q1695_007293 [Nippostrongylus brasiliensis]
MSRRGGDLDAKVYIGGLPHDATSQEIEDTFHRFGRIRKVWVARRPPGFAFVEFEDTRDAEDAVKSLDGARICGVRARVELSHGKRRNGAGGGGGGGGGYGGRGYGGGGGGGGYGGRRSSVSDLPVYRHLPSVFPSLSFIVTYLPCCVKLLSELQAKNSTGTGLDHAVVLHHAVVHGRVHQMTEEATAEAAVVHHKKRCKQLNRWSDLLDFTICSILFSRRAWNAPDGAEEAEVPVLRGALPMFPVAPPLIRPANPPPARNLRRGAARIRAESPDTAIEYDQNEVDALKRMKEIASRQMNGQSFIKDTKEKSFVVVNDDVRAVRESEEKFLLKEMEAHLKMMERGVVDKEAILMLMKPLVNFVERLEMELRNTRNLLMDIEARQADLSKEMKHVDNVCEILRQGCHEGNEPQKN